MKNFFNSCRRCVHPWVFVLIVVVVIGLLVFVPVVGVAGLVVAAPLIGCTVMCGAMAYFMRRNKDT